VHGEIGPAIEHRGLHPLAEHAPAAHLAHRDVGPTVKPVVSTSTSSPSTPHAFRSRWVTKEACQWARMLPRVATLRMVNC
jgi:hypothetical protein